MLKHVSSGLNLLRMVRDETDSIGVAVSFGKDSLATLDLCCQLFSRVEAYYLYRVRGLRIVDEWSERVRRHWNVEVRMYPHFDLVRCYRNGVLSPHWKGAAKTPAVKMRDIENHFRQTAKVDWLAMGWRRNDSFSRALIMRQTGGIDWKNRRVFPLRAWRRADVMSYLHSHGIPLPDSLGRKEQGGLDFHPDALRRLKTDYPDDYQRWLVDFPFSEIQLKTGQDSRELETAQ